MINAASYGEVIKPVIEIAGYPASPPAGN